ncbi:MULTISPECIES: LysR substrate-binding domain-containing protein [Burkholderia]|uniref:LysR substrate-binding domain-containing protein n=1 Tax=Burkholderia TaxID=32008 RepID=UPI00064FF56F|nr:MULTISPECIES: LysR substrate-binding domain-containing protein [Burkholderia]KML19268.1 LysR family transcriptional regulator [Burkholderia cepacia]KML41076.1 LysR family transcriptional regulator [Burkholderia lata]KMN59896.1 LysR family transcriptional regulator [Burkholderia sp. LK4]KVA50473.1 LysR family transcriptional regulator [Burkholderia cepacia]KVC31453.1 LysR family transcriptional regulator [Burkholderia cepacia]
MRRLPPLNALRSFEAAGRLQSLTLAADELNVTQSAVAQQIRVLESFFGQKLFERDGRSLRLTPRARHYLVDVASCLGRLAQATGQMFEPVGGHSIRINASVSFAHGWLLTQLAVFQAAHPDIDVQLVTSADMERDQFDETCDIVIRRYTPELRRKGFVSRPLLANVALPVCAPGHPALERVRVPADLRDAPLLHYAGLPQAWQYWFHQAGTDATETLRGPFYREFFLLVQAAASGLGVCLAPRAVVRDDLARGRLIALFPEVHLEGPPFHCLYRNDDDPALRTFIDWLFARAEALDGPPPQ